MSVPSSVGWSLVLSALAVACGSNAPDATTPTSHSAGGDAPGDAGKGADFPLGSGEPGDGGILPDSGADSDAGALADGGGDAALAATALVAGVNVHAYPKPSAYGYVAADGSDRMGGGLTALGSPPVRGATIGDTTFLARLASFGVKEVVLMLSPSAEGKPFDPTAVAPLLTQSLAAAQPLGLTIQVEGLNEWDLFNSKSYNAGVIPPGMSASDFVSYTQKALYEAAHPLGLQVLGPSVGHPADATSLAFFPDVSAYVDVVNMHLYFTSTPETIPIATFLASHQLFEGKGKPLWITETGYSAYGGVTAAEQADVIKRGLGAFAASGLVSRAYIYELLDDTQPGVSGTTYTPDSSEYHFGLFAFDGTAEPAAASFQQFAGVP
jgi:hypothetical protein